MDFFRELGAFCKSTVKWLLLLLVISFAVGIIFGLNSGPTVPKAKLTDSVEVTVVWVLHPHGEYIVESETDSHYKGTFQDCYIIDELITSDATYGVNPFYNRAVDILRSFHLLGNFPLLNESQASALASQYGYEMMTEEGVMVMKAKISISKESLDEFHKSYINHILLNPDKKEE